MRKREHIASHPSTGHSSGINDNKLRKCSLDATSGNAVDSESKSKTRGRTRREVDYEGENEAINDIEDFGKEEILRTRASLLEWYHCCHRNLPWRKSAKIGTLTSSINNHSTTTLYCDTEFENADTRAYAVWVSEVMLQQTRVQSVIGYYKRWMEKWPTLHHLAKASIEEVNDVWAGLGYYRRAKFLLEGAKRIANDGSGFPNNAYSLRKIPGIGEYTAGAIASIAFNEAVPVVDGNVVRVICRLKAITANPKDSKTMKKIWKLAGQLVDPSLPGDFNQALMELGAVTCTPSNPQCSTCPLSGVCVALATSKKCNSIKVIDYPAKAIKIKQRHDFSAVCVVEILEADKLYPQPSSEFLLVKRPEDGLLAGLWEFPSVLLKGETDTASRREALNLFLERSFSITPGKTCSIVLRKDVGVYTHVFTHIRLKMYVELLVLSAIGGGLDVPEKSSNNTPVWQCVDSKTLSNMGLTSGVKKVFAMVQEFKQNL